MLQMSANLAGNAIKLRVFSSFADCEDAWRAFEEHALMTPYQQIGWLEPWFRHVGAEQGMTPLLVRGETNGKTVFLWPFGVQRINGLRVCRWLGGKQCNYNFGMYDRDILPELDIATLRAFLQSVAEAAGGIDVFELYNQPQSWNGHTNPFSQFEQQASPSPCYRMALSGDFEALEKTTRNARSIQSLRRKGRKLAAKYGPTRVATPECEGEFAPIFQAFLAQRAVRFGAMGVPNVFADSPMNAFLNEVSRSGPDGGRPILQFHALLAGGDICATYAGLMQNGHYSCFVNSVDLTEFGKFSPGELMLSGLIEQCCGEGLTGFDLGMGEERYKLSWCREDPLFDSFIPITSLGRLQTAKVRALLSIKRTIRSNPKLWSMAKSVRKQLRGTQRQ